MSTITRTDLASTTCAHCHIEFAMPSTLRDELRRTHERFYCPRGHHLVFNGRTEEQKLKARLDNAEASRIALLDQLEAAERSRRAQKGVTTRIKNRIARGVCPCCNRSFTNVREHMAGQHPDFAKEATE